MKDQNLKPLVLLALVLSVLSLFLIVFVLWELRGQREIFMHIAESKPGTREGDPYVRSAVKNRILKGYSDLHNCYQSYLAHKPAIGSGRVKIDWEIDTSGKVSSPEIVWSEIPDETFQNCLLEKIKDWEFSEPPIKKYVEHVFHFKDDKSSQGTTSSQKK
ncbi:MAG: AgmX/PglI C-terminal domain-containing protein [Leptospiraceae bacterium]|nr:AgmX/PglI C-terminal domain-containing protein [Leptospiraceae bacterium]MDW8306618.1 AgmX/PglI C-terminal domain-containing protein [Leptospiraceae bacterium]